jgi:hypothetical protein
VRWEWKEIIKRKHLTKEIILEIIHCMFVCLFVVFIRGKAEEKCTQLFLKSFSWKDVIKSDSDFVLKNKAQTMFFNFLIIFFQISTPVIGRIFQACWNWVMKKLFLIFLDSLINFRVCMVLKNHKSYLQFSFMSFDNQQANNQTLSDVVKA